MAESEVTLKLLIDTKNKHKVHFAEANKNTFIKGGFSHLRNIENMNGLGEGRELRDRYIRSLRVLNFQDLQLHKKEAGKNAVDFLFHILTLPLGTLVRLLKNQKVVGCLSNLYDSVENLNEAYIEPNQTKDAFLKPIAPVIAADSCPLFSLHDNNRQPLPKPHYMCNKNLSACGGHSSDGPNAVCPQCKLTMSKKLTYIAQQTGRAQPGGSLVKGVVTYMIMDDLVVEPMSTILFIALLNKFNVTEVRSLVEKEVDLGIDEALQLLEASLASKTVFTSVFLKNMHKHE